MEGYFEISFKPTTSTKHKIYCCMPIILSPISLVVWSLLLLENKTLLTHENSESNFTHSH